MKEITEELEKLIDILNKDVRIKKIDSLKKEILSNKKLISKINKLHTLDIYSEEYKNIKKELFNNPSFVEFKLIEAELNYLILEINQKLNALTNKRECNHENN